MAIETYLPFALHKNVGEEGLVKTLQHTCPTGVQYAPSLLSLYLTGRKIDMRAPQPFMCFAFPSDHPAHVSWEHREPTELEDY